MKNKKLILTMIFVGIASTSLELLPAFIGIGTDNDGIGIGIGRNGIGAEVGDLEVGIGSDYNNDYYDGDYDENNDYNGDYDRNGDYDSDGSGVIIGADIGAQRYGEDHGNRRSRNIRTGRQTRGTRMDSGKTTRGGRTAGGRSRAR